MPDIQTCLTSTTQTASDDAFYFGVGRQSAPDRTRARDRFCIINLECIFCELLLAFLLHPSDEISASLADVLEHEAEYLCRVALFDYMSRAHDLAVAGSDDSFPDKNLGRPALPQLMHDAPHTQPVIPHAKPSCAPSSWQGLAAILPCSSITAWSLGTSCMRGANKRHEYIKPACA